MSRHKLASPHRVCLSVCLCCILLFINVSLSLSLCLSLSLSALHREKVQSVLWHPHESSLLFSGDLAGALCLFDGRATSSLSLATLPSGVESMAVDPFRSYYLYVAEERGAVSVLDLRRLSSPPVSSPASSPVSPVVGAFSPPGGETVSCLSFSPSCPGLLVSVSLDGSLSVFDTLLSPAETPQLVSSKHMNVGGLFSGRFSVDSPFVFVCGGDSGQVALWEMDETAAIADRFTPRLTSTSTSTATSRYSGGSYDQSLSSLSVSALIERQRDRERQTERERERLVEELETEMSATRRKENKGKKHKKK